MVEKYPEIRDTKKEKSFVFNQLQNARTSHASGRRLGFAQQPRSNNQRVIFKIHRSEHTKLLDMLRQRFRESIKPQVILIQINFGQQ